MVCRSCGRSEGGLFDVTLAGERAVTVTLCARCYDAYDDLEWIEEAEPRGGDDGGDGEDESENAGGGEGSDGRAEGEVESEGADDDGGDGGAGDTDDDGSEGEGG